MFGVETIEQFLATSYDEFAGRATVTAFLPLLAERFARQRLRALRKVESTSTDTRPSVLFLCVHNAGRSQMAMGFFEHYAGDRGIAWSGGSEPGSAVEREAVTDVGARIPRQQLRPSPIAERGRHLRPSGGAPADDPADVRVGALRRAQVRTLVEEGLQLALELLELPLPFPHVGQLVREEVRHVLAGTLIRIAHRASPGCFRCRRGRGRTPVRIG